MCKSGDATKAYRAKVQRSPAGAVLGACLAIGAEDISFVDPHTEWLTIQKKKTENRLIVEIRGQAP